MPGPTAQQGYVGRFAPSPTGPLHMGSVVAALASYLDARHHNGTWLLRIEDLDPPREDPAAPEFIINQLRALGLNWDGDVVFQGSRRDAYEDALAQLAPQCFPCTCTRKTTSHPYQGTCRENTFAATRAPYAIRFRVTDTPISINDRYRGPCAWAGDAYGDFIIRRKDGLFAYQLAVVVDDLAAGVTDVVRGDDLLESTPWQLQLYRAFGATPPRYAHIPVVLGADGDKLSKQTGAPAANTSEPLTTLRSALTMLGQSTLPDITTVPQLLKEATRRWQLKPS